MSFELEKRILFDGAGFAEVAAAAEAVEAVDHDHDAGVPADGRDAVEQLLDADLGGLLPADKVLKVEELLTAKPEGSTLGFVGDGINDAPVLARADIGIAMGGIGSDAAVEAADVVIMTDEPSRLVDAIVIARKTMRIVKQNIIFAIGVKVLVLILTALGFATMWAAVFADVGVSVLAILNAIRALNYKKARDKAFEG